MYFAFIDESGTTHQNDKDNLIYVYCALIMQEKGWKYLHNETMHLKQRIWKIIKKKDAGYESPDNFEIHLKDIVNRNNYFKNLKDNDRSVLSIFNMIYSLISKLFAKIISIIIIKVIFYIL